MIDNDKEILKNIIGYNNQEGQNTAGKIFCYYKNVAEELNIPVPKNEKLFKENIEITISEVLVLTGSKRDIWSKFYSNQQNLQLYCNAKIDSVVVEGNKIKEILINIAGGEQVQIIAKEFLLSMGVIDSNIFAMQHLNNYLGEKYIKIGTHLHDHWSVPIAKFKWDKHSEINSIFPPKFLNGQVIGRRINLREEDKINCNGFIHVQASYDTTPPYSVLKEIVFAKQKKLPISKLLMESVGLFPYIPTLFGLAYERFINQSLYLPKDTELTIVLDFESDSDKKNRIELKNGIPNLFWDLRDKDYANFISLFKSSKKILNQFFPENKISFNNELEMKPNVYLMNNVIDAYHLGGGITMGNDRDDFVDLDLRFYDINNLALVSTAMFNRPGIANPVYTLLAFAEYYISSIN